MSFDRFLQILFGLLAAFTLFTLVRALRTGRLGYASAAVERASDPAHYWYSFAALATLPGAFSILMFDSRFGAAGMQLLLGLSVAYYPLRWLRTGEAGWENAMFSRREEPLQYWLLVALLGLAILASTAVAAAGVVQAWALRGVP